MAKKRSTRIKALVVLCSCNNTIGKVVDFDRLSETLKKYPEVADVVRNDTFCGEDGGKFLSEQLKSSGADRVILAGCTPRTHENLLSDMVSEIEEPSIGADLTEQVGIREQCEWVHDDRNLATNKALWMIAGALGKLSTARDLIELDNSKLDFNKDIAVIGAGAAGIQTALDLGDSGLNVHLIEKSDELGGRTVSLNLDDLDKKLLPDINRVKEHDKITVKTGTEVNDIAGGLGSYSLKLSSGDELTVGGIVVATGSELFDADRIAEYRYNLPQVVNSLDLDKLLAEQSEGLKLEGARSAPQNIHFIQCVGSRDENYNPYCTLICCTIAVKQAIELKLRLPESNIYVHYMDMRGPYPGFEEKFIDAQKAGVTFSRGRVGDIIPAEKGASSPLELRSESVELGEIFNWPADLVVLSVGHEPAQGATEFANQLFFPADRDSFNVEHNYHIDLKDRRGVAFVGTAQGPRFMRQALADARRAAYEFIEFFGSDIFSRDVRSVIDELRCAGCGTCVELCPYDAIKLDSVYDYEREAYKRVAVIDVNTCQGCGACAAGCPSGVPTLHKYSTEQMWRQIEEMI